MNVKLKNPDINPKVLVLFGNSATDKTSFYFDDFCTLASSFGLVDTTNGVAMDTLGSLTPTGLKNFLATYALLIKEYRFLAEDDADLANNLTAVHTSPDGTSSQEVVFSADAVSPFQNNPNLLVIKQPFVWTASTALKVSTVGASGHDMTFTFTVATMIPYGQLDVFLSQNPIMRGGQ